MDQQIWQAGIDGPPCVMARSQREIVFILCAPRSGSTLMRVMLAGHSQMFSPPELNLLPFCTLRERDSELGETAGWLMGCDQRAGLIEAVMHLTGMDGAASDAWLRKWIDRNFTIDEAYGLLCGLAAPRQLVDKSTRNASCSAFLAKSRLISPRARYLHLVRHPYSAIESLQRTYLNDISQQHAFHDAELLWTVPNRNITCFSRGLDPRQYLRVAFENLVHRPEAVMRRVCTFLRIDFEPAVLEPYEGQRMTEGSPGRFESLGDPNFHNHRHIERKLGEVWRNLRPPGRLSCLTRMLAAEFQYELP